jgi:hypothetical protein
MEPVKPQHGDGLIRRRNRMNTERRFYGKRYRVLMGTEDVIRVQRIKLNYEGSKCRPVGPIHWYEEGQ